MSTTNETPERRTYTDVQRAQALAALAANGGNLTKTARQLDIPRKTIEHWRDADSGQPPEIADLRARQRAALAQRFEELAELCLDVVERKVDQLSGKDAAITSAICVDKSQLLRGGPTEIVETRDAEERTASLRERYTKLRTNLPEEPSDN